MYHDGRGAGLGNYVLNQNSSSITTGVKADSRDYDAVALLLENHIKNKKMKVLYSQTSRLSLARSLQNQGMKVEEWLAWKPRNKEKATS